MLISLLAGLSNKSPLDSCIRELTQARDDGFERVWMTQMPYDCDLLTVLAAAMHEVSDIKVASGVVPIQNQHPMLMAQRVLTLNQIAGGRFTLGIGVTHRAVTEGMWGISWDRSVRRLSEYLDGLLPLLAGEQVNATGEMLTTRGALQISGAPTPDVYVAALGPQMLRLSGRRTAGTITWMTGPKTLKEHIGPTMRAAAADAGPAHRRHRRRGRSACSGGRAVRDVRPLTLLSRDVGSRGLRGTGRRRAHRRRGHGARQAR